VHLDAADRFEGIGEMVDPGRVAVIWGIPIGVAPPPGPAPAKGW
jgi:hypothetical protein